MKNLRLLKILIFGFAFLIIAKLQPVYAQQWMDVHDPDAPQVKYIGHPFVIQPRIYLDSQNIDTLAMRLMHFTPARNTISNVSIRTLFSSQVVLDDTTDNVAGTQRIDIGKVALTPDYTNTSYTPFADITFLAIDTGLGAGGVCTSENGFLDCTSTFTLDYDGGPLQSGAFLGGVNYLDGVTSLTISLQEDDTLPIWSNCLPAAGSSNVPVVSNVECDFQDFQTGIYLGGTTINIFDNYGFNNITYANGGPNSYSATGISDGYHIIVDPVENFPYAATITVYGTGQDNAYNNGPVLDRNTGTFITSGLANPYTFTTEDDVDAPQIYNRVPDDGQTGVPVSTNVDFNLRDIHSTGLYPGLGIDINTLSVTISAPGWGTHTYTVADSQLTATVLATNTPYGNPYDYHISIDPDNDFPQNTWVTVQVTVGDYHVPANVLSTSYSFLTADTIAPYCYLFRPEPGSTDVAVNDRIIFRCADSGVGVDIDSLNVVVDKIIYTRSGANQFTYTGDSSEYEITIDPTYDWASSYAFEVIINVSDLSGNAMGQISYGLATGVGTATCHDDTVCDDCSCEDQIVETINTVYSETEVPFRSTTQEMDSVRLLLINNSEVLALNSISVQDRYVKLAGTASPNAYVTILFESTPFILTTIADENGNWNMQIRNIFELGMHKIYAVARNEQTDEITSQKYLASFEIIKETSVSSEVISGLSRIPYECCIGLLLLLLLLLFLYKKRRKNEKNSRKIQKNTKRK